jgi:hypothetical protein
MANEQYRSPEEILDAWDEALGRKDVTAAAAPRRGDYHL